jgi:hypothetical protein
MESMGKKPRRPRQFTPEFALRASECPVRGITGTVWLVRRAT